MEQFIPKDYYEGEDDMVVSKDCQIHESEFLDLQYAIPILLNEGETHTFGASCGCAFFTAVAMRRQDGSDYTLLRPATLDEQRELLDLDDEDEG